MDSTQSTLGAGSLPLLILSPIIHLRRAASRIILTGMMPHLYDQQPFPQRAEDPAAVRDSVIAGTSVQLRRLPYEACGTQVDRDAERARFERQSFRSGNAS